MLQANSLALAAPPPQPDDARLAVPTADLALLPGAPREQWLAARRQGVCGSDVAAILHRSPYTTAAGVYLDKLGIAPAFEETEAMMWGTALEPVIADVWARREGVEVWTTGTYVHRQHPWMRANPDRLGNGFGLEVKTCNERKRYEWGTRDDPAIPFHFLTQVGHYAAVTGIADWIVICLVGGQELVVRHVEIDADDVAALIAVARKFWHRHVLRRRPPLIVARDAERMHWLYPGDADAPDVELPPRLHRVVVEHARAKAEIGRLTKLVKGYEVEIKTAMGNAPRATVRGRKAVTWLPGTRPKMIADPDGTTTPVRVFRNTSTPPTENEDH